MPENLMTMVLVTGASGFIGQHLVKRLLREGCRVRILVRNTSLDSFPGTVEVAHGDVRNQADMKAATAGVDIVYHLAAYTEPSGSPENEAACQLVNVEGTQNVLDAAVSGGARRFVFFSSVKVFGEETSACLDESAAQKPTTPYGRSKLEAERAVLDYRERTGLEAIVLRLPLVYGPHNRGNIYQLISAIDRGIFPPPPAVLNRRSLVHVANVVEAAMLVSQNPVPPSSCYIVTDAKSYSTRELYESICRALGKRVPRWHVPLSLLVVLAQSGDIASRLMKRPFPVNSGSLQKLIGSAWYSSEKISRELGYSPTITLEAALPELIAWYRTV
jgi:nucleoside-diphosphate-sugar epimerase